MRIYYDIETVPKEAAEIEDMMPPEIKNPRLPYDLENVRPPKLEDFSHGNLKDPVKLQEWRESKIREFHANHKAKIDKWNEEAMDKRIKFIDRAALDPGLCRIRLVGFRTCDYSTVLVSENTPWTAEEDSQINAIHDLTIIRFSDEKLMLKAAWEYIEGEDEEAPFVGFHSNRFDLPMMKRRAWANAVKVRIKTMRGAYVNGDKFVDLHEVWQSGDRTVMDGMNKVAKSLGIDITKSGTGEKFSELYKKDRVAAIMYNVMDLVITEQIAERIL